MYHVIFCTRAERIRRRSWLVALEKNPGQSGGGSLYRPIRRLLRGRGKCASGRRTRDLWKDRMSEVVRAIFSSSFFSNWERGHFLFSRTCIRKRQAAVRAHVCIRGLCVTSPWEVSSGNRNVVFFLASNEAGRGVGGGRMHFEWGPLPQQSKARSLQLLISV